MAPRETLATAVTPGSSLRVSPLPPGTARPLRKTRTPMRFATAHCTTSVLIPPHRRLKPLQTSGSLKPALQLRLKSKLLPSRTLRQQQRRVLLPLHPRRQLHHSNTYAHPNGHANCNPDDNTDSNSTRNTDGYSYSYSYSHSHSHSNTKGRSTFSPDAASAPDSLIPE